MLEKLAADRIKEFDEVFPKETEKQRELFELLGRAYIEARYEMHFFVSREDLLWLEQYVLMLKDVVRQLSDNEGVVTELLEAVPDNKTLEEFMTELEASWEESGKKALALKTIQDYKEDAFKQGEKSGMQKGMKQGKTEGYKLGKEEGKTEGIQIGKISGLEEGKTEGYKLGEEKGKSEGFELGKQAGLQKGKDVGYQLGKKAGVEKGKSEGEKQKALQMAKALKEKGVDTQIIAETSGLPLETIETL